MLNNIHISPVVIILSIIIVVAIVLLVFLSRRKAKHSAEIMKYQIYVGNLPYRLNEYDLKQFFEKYGEISDVRIMKNPRTRRSKGYGFVTFESMKEARLALACNGKLIEGRTIIVRIARPPREREK